MLINLSKYRSQLYGFSALFIVFFHSQVMFTIKGFHIIKQFGSLGVDVFLLLSGMSLYFSFSKDSNLKHFFQKRISTIIIPLGIVNLIYYQLVPNGSGFIMYLKNVIGLFHSEKLTLNSWFSLTIIILYLLYPLIHKFLESSSEIKRLVKFGIIFSLWWLFQLTKFYFVTPEFASHTNLAFARFPIFLIGCYLGPYILNRTPFFGIKINKHASIGVTLLLFISSCSLLIPYIQVDNKYQLIPTFISISVVMTGTLLLSWLLNLMSKAKSSHLVMLVSKSLTLFGGLSFEIYLLFEKNQTLFESVAPVDPHNLAKTCFLFTLTLIEAILLKKVVTYIKQNYDLTKP